MMNKKETASILAFLASAYPSIKITKETAEVYHDVLQDLGYPECVETVRQCVRVSQFFPSASEIRRGVLRDKGLLSPLPSEAWSEVIGVASREGLNKSNEWSHATVAETVKAIGWREICFAENQGVLRAHFLKMYDSFRETNDRKTLSNRQLEGLTEGEHLEFRALNP